ncbi:MAG: TlpA disulfide reductase family protein, partial [Acidobacteriota bacterium]
MNRWQQLLLAFTCLLMAYFSGAKIADRSNKTIIKKMPAIVKPVRTTITSRANLGVGMGEVIDFSLLDESGRSRTFSELRDGHPTLVYFFAGGCRHCQSLLPQMESLTTRVRERGYRVVGIQYYGSPEQGREFLDRYKLPSPILADSQAEVCSRFKVGEFTVFLVGANNNLYFREVINGSNWPGEAIIDDVLAQGGNAVVEGFEPADSVNIERFANTILANQPNLQRLYNPISISLILLIILTAFVMLVATNGSWLPVLAAGELLLMGVVYDLWL